MAQVGSIASLIVGAALLGAVMHTAVPPAAWLALAALLHASRSIPALPGMPGLWLALFVAQLAGRRATIPASGFLYLGIIAVETTMLTIPFVLDRVAAPRLGPLAATLIFPMSLVAVEFLRSRVTTAATWGSIAYTQYGSLALMQIAAFVGIWGITFMIAWGAATFEWAWRQQFVWSTVRTPVVTCAVVFGVVMVGGAARVALAQSGWPALRVATLNRPVDLFVPGEMTRIAEGKVSADERTALDAKLTQLHQWFLDGSRREARAGARLVVWPEMNLLVFADDERAFVARAQRLAAEERVYLAMGMGTVHPGDVLPLENKLIVIDPVGRIVISYRKTHPVAGWEASIMKRGDGRVPVAEISEARVAAAICFDGSFPEFMRQASAASANLLILPVNEWKGIEQIHFQMDAFRAVENGMPLVRAAAAGLSTAIDPWGRVLGMTDYFAAGDRTMTAQVPLGRVWTLYGATGDIFPWACAAGLVLALIRIFT